MASEGVDCILEQDVDVCIVGSGPDALSVLSALHEPFAKLSPAEYSRAIRDKKRPKDRLKVCVVSPSAPAWLSDWEERFDALEITHLRSPASAHPDLYASQGLMEFAQENGREAELVDVGVRNAKELGSMNARLREVDEGLYDIPSASLFLDFCRSLASELPHRCVQGHVVGIDLSEGEVASQCMKVHVLQQDDRQVHVSARNVVLAIGAPGPSTVPQVFECIPPQVLTHTSNAAGLMILKREAAKIQVLVVGGGLSAIQAAISFARRGSHVVLASRRPLYWRHFDLPIPWFDRRTHNIGGHRFLSTNMEDRATFIKDTRGGGTVPPWYRKKLSDSGVECVVAKVTAAYHEGNHEVLEGGAPVHVTLEELDGSTRAVQVNHVILGTGATGDFLKIPLMKEMQAKWPVDVVNGLPVIGQDLRWTPGLPMYVVGGLAALRVGPDASNLMGARRAAEKVAQNLGVYDQLEEAGSVSCSTNAFSALLDDSSDGDDSNDDGDGFEFDDGC